MATNTLVFDLECVVARLEQMRDAGHHDLLERVIDSDLPRLKKHLDMLKDSTEKSPKVVQANNLDSVRIEILGGARAVTIPASLVLAADTVMRDLVMDTDARLTVHVQRQHPEGPNQWSATLHGKSGYSITPWGAICALAEKLEA